jgi:hypothetical protein
MKIGGDEMQKYMREKRSLYQLCPVARNYEKSIKEFLATCNYTQFPETGLYPYVIPFANARNCTKSYM